jgi:transposase
LPAHEKQLEDSVRKMICEEHKNLKSNADIARKYKVHRQTVASVVALYRKEKRITSMKGRRRRSITEEMEGVIREVGPFTRLEWIRTDIFTV